MATRQIADTVNQTLSELPEESENGDHAARDRRNEIRGHSEYNELPDRHGSIAHFPGARGDCAKLSRCSAPERQEM